MNRMHLVVLAALIVPHVFAQGNKPSKRDYRVMVSNYVAAQSAGDLTAALAVAEEMIGSEAAKTNSFVEVHGNSLKVRALYKQDPETGRSAYREIVKKYSGDDAILFVGTAISYGGVHRGVLPPKEALGEMEPLAQRILRGDTKLGPAVKAPFLSSYGQALAINNASRAKVVEAIEAVAAMGETYRAATLAVSLKETAAALAIAKAYSEAAAATNATALPLLALVAQHDGRSSDSLLWLASMLEKFGYALGANPALKPIYEAMNPYYLDAKDLPEFKARLRRAAESVWKPDQTNEARKALAAAIVSYTDGLPAGK